MLPTSLGMYVIAGVALLSLSTGTILGSETSDDSHRPCYGCALFNLLQKDRSHSRRAVQKQCSRCYCPDKVVRCTEGVRKIRDGCNCCFMCARQHGDMCSVRDKCEIQQDLYCDIPAGGEYGVCRAFQPKPCQVNGVEYQDGQMFRPDCRRQCTCQNGNYGCISLCPQEDNKPSPEHCPNARLAEFRNKCCKEWTCSPEITVKSPRHLKVQSANLMMSSYKQHQKSQAFMTSSQAVCRDDSNWSACSRSCGVGISWRIQPKNCSGPKNETRLCYIRPCGQKIHTLGRRKCTPTTRLVERQHIVYGKCHSMRKYRMKLCTNCRKNRCCYPKMQQTRSIPFKCTGGVIKYYKFAWIKRCTCTRKCKNRNRKRN